MKSVLMTTVVGALLSLTVSGHAQDNCPWDATGPNIIRDCEVTYGYAGDPNWWEYDVEACWSVSPDNASTPEYHEYAGYFPRCDVDGDGYISMDDVVDIYYHMGDCPASPHEIESLAGYATNSKVVLIFKGQPGITDGFRIAYKEGAMPEDCSGDDGSTVYVETNAHADMYVINQPGGNLYARVCSYSDVACNDSEGLTVHPENLEASPHTQCIADNLQTLEQRPLPYYLALFAEHANLMETIGLCQKSALHQEIFWDALETTEVTGAPIDQPTPPEYAPWDPAFEWLDWQEVDRNETIRANMQAWAFYLELHQVFNWSLLDYTPELLNLMLNRQNLFGGVIDFSIADTYNVAVAQLPGGQEFDGTQREAVLKILDLGRQLRHGLNGGDLAGTPVTVEDMLNVNQNTPAEWFDESYYRARKGCGSTVAFLNTVTAALNIPTHTLNGHMHSHKPHPGWAAPTVDMAFIHGDDIYRKTSRNVPTDELPDSYQRLINEGMNPHGHLTFETYWHGDSHRARIAAKYPSDYLVDVFCRDYIAGGCYDSKGWSGIRDYRIGFYLDPNITQKACPGYEEFIHVPDGCDHTWEPELLDQLYADLCALAPHCDPGCN